MLLHLCSCSTVLYFVRYDMYKRMLCVFSVSSLLKQPATYMAGYLYTGCSNFLKIKKVA